MADALSKTSLEKDLNVADLCFEGGDVVIYLSREDEDILILHSETLIKASRWFEAAFTRWQKPRTLDGGSKPVYQLYLTYDRDLQSWTLSSKAETGGSPEFTSEEIPRLYASRFPVRGDGRFLSTASEARKSSILGHKCIFALVYKLYSGYADIETYAPLMGDVVVLAEFYQLLPVVSARVERNLAMQLYNEIDVVENPAFYLGFSEMLQSPGLFKEALRHYIGSGKVKERVQNLNSEVARLAYLKAIELQSRLSDLEWAVRNIDLNLPTPFFTDVPDRPRTRAQEAIFLAYSIFLNWLATQTPRAADKSSPEVFAFYLELHRQGVHSNITVFGHSLCRKANGAYRCLSWEAERHFSRALHQYLEEASRLIGEVMYSTDAPPARSEGTGRPYFTHMTIADKELPWAEDEEVREDNSGEEDGDDELQGAADKTLHGNRPRENGELENWLETREHPDTIEEHIKRQKELKRDQSNE